MQILNNHSSNIRNEWVGVATGFQAHLTSGTSHKFNKLTFYLGNCFAIFKATQCMTESCFHLSHPTWETFP